jgi:hypothetical protein
MIDSVRSVAMGLVPRFCREWRGALDGLSPPFNPEDTLRPGESHLETA